MITAKNGSDLQCKVQVFILPFSLVHSLYAAWKSNLFNAGPSMLTVIRTLSLAVSSLFLIAVCLVLGTKTPLTFCSTCGQDEAMEASFIKFGISSLWCIPSSSHNAVVLAFGYCSLHYCLVLTQIN